MCKNTSICTSEYLKFASSKILFVCVRACACVLGFFLTLYTSKVDKISPCIAINDAVCSAVLGYMQKKFIICCVICLPQLPVSRILLLGMVKLKLVRIVKLLVGIMQ